LLTSNSFLIKEWAHPDFHQPLLSLYKRKKFLGLKKEKTACLSAGLGRLPFVAICHSLFFFASHFSFLLEKRKRLF